MWQNIMKAKGTSGKKGFSNLFMERGGFVRTVPFFFFGGTDKYG